MPGRAEQMTPGQAYEMGGSRWNVPLGVLTNKKALDMAFQQHVWEMQKQAATLASGEKIAGVRAETAKDVAGIRSGGVGGLSKSVAAKAYAKALDWAALNLDDNDPDWEDKVQQVYQQYLSITGGGASTLAAGGSPAATAPDESAKPAVTSGTPGRAPQASAAEYTALNKQTGQRMVWRNGAWIPWQPL
jgi:hypothetical protein